MDDATRRLRNRVLPGAALLDDHNTWAPVVPYDADSPPPPVEGGTSTCDACSRTLPLTALNITAHGYRCDACAAAAIQQQGPAVVDASNVKVGRGRWWLWPAIIAPSAAITILYPGAVFIVVAVAALLVFAIFMRRGV